MLLRSNVAVDRFNYGISWLEAIKYQHLSRRNRLLSRLAHVWLQILRRYDVIVVSDTIGMAREASLLEPLVELRKPVSVESKPCDPLLRILRPHRLQNPDGHHVL